MSPATAELSERESPVCPKAAGLLLVVAGNLCYCDEQSIPMAAETPLLPTTRLPTQAFQEVSNFSRKQTKPDLREETRLQVKINKYHSRRKTSVEETSQRTPDLRPEF